MNSFNEYLGHEIYINVFVQENFQYFELLFEQIAVFLSPKWIIYNIMPILVSHDMILKTRAIFVLSILDLFACVVKWSSGMDRPYWWVRENNGPEIRQHRLTCETTSGCPSAHSMIFTATAYITALSLIPHLQQQFHNHPVIAKQITFVLMWVAIIMMWLDRIYFACHFPHQCVLASAVALLIISLTYRTSLEKKIFNFDKHTWLVIVISVLILVIAIYFKNLNDGTELRSVKMAFKWCTDPGYLKHDDSPVYWLGRSFGLVLGLALSAPLSKRAAFELNPHLSVPITVFFVSLNSALDIYTPRGYGRLAYVGYGAARSTLLIYSLLNFVPFFSGTKIHTIKS